MKTRSLPFVLLSFMVCVMLVAAGCSKNAEEPTPQPSASHETPAPAPAASPAPAQPAPAASAPAGGSKASIAGIEWTVPASWSPQGERPMRIATYSIPASAGDTEGGECAVFYFGSGQGGDVRANIDRWVGQFKTDGKPEESTKTVNGINVTTVKVAGTYLAPSGPMMQSSGEKAGFRLIGTILEAPEGAVFFKATGPAATIAASEKDITALVDSVHKVGQ